MIRPGLYSGLLHRNGLEESDHPKYNFKIIAYELRQAVVLTPYFRTYNSHYVELQ